MCEAFIEAQFGITNDKGTMSLLVVNCSSFSFKNFISNVLESRHDEVDRYRRCIPATATSGTSCNHMQSSIHPE